MNEQDSEQIAGILTTDGYTLIDDPERADVVVFNTCCVRVTAEQRAIGRITQFNRIKRSRPDFTIVVCGCIAQKDGEELIANHPFIDLVVGPRDIARIGELLTRVRENHLPVVSVDNIGNRIEYSTPRLLRNDLKAFVTIMYGCDNFCSYCIVPYVRGREVSRPKGEIISEIESFADRGIKEITLIGQNVNSYHGGSVDFPDLLDAVNDVPGIERIRYITSHPKDASEKLIGAVKNLSHVCENFHIPTQSGSNPVLEAMNRGYSREDYIALAANIKSEIPDAVITTDLIVGFPGETDEDFEETMDLLETVRWDSSFIFIYSVRPGTKAAELGDTIPRETKIARITRLIKRQEEISNEINRAMWGSTKELLVESCSKRSQSELMGRTRGDKVVIFPGETSMIGTLIDVEITDSSAHTVFGKVIKKIKR